jgi:DNA-binding response OmpR family regulator
MTGQEPGMRKRIPILIIDDDADFLQLVEYHLKLFGFQPFCAASGQEGLRIAQETLPEVILLDTTMPGMDGLEVLSELKFNETTAGIPVFMLTAKTMIGDIDQAFEVGADDYITKPVELRSLARIIQRKIQKLSDQKK